MRCGSVCLEGNIDFYEKSAFTFASEYGICYYELSEGEDGFFFLYSCGMDVDELMKIYQKEFIEERVKSFIIFIITSLGLMFVISLIAPDLRMSTLIKYYGYKNF